MALPTKLKIKFFILIALFVISLGLGSSNTFAQSDQGSAATDTQAPADVENVKAIPGDKEITLTWDIAADNVGVTGYKIYNGTQSVNVDGQSYEFPVISVEDVVTHTVTERENGKTYYFAVTAFDAAQNESANYSIEVSATPQEGLKSAAIEDDGKSPEAVKAETKEKDTVKVEFSEPVVLPIEDPEKAFVIKKKAEKETDQTPLDVDEAELDPEDLLGKTVLLLTENQEKNVEYELTVGLEVEDHFGNAVVQDKGDKFSFYGFGTEQGSAAVKPMEESAQETPQDTEAPKVSEVKVPVGNQVQVIFSESVSLGQNPKSNFTIAKKDGGQALPITNVSLSKDGKTAFINTDPQQMGVYELRFAGITDSAGNETESKSVEFDGKSSDTTPPEDATELIAQFVAGKKNVVELSWKKSKNSAGDLADQLLYQSENQGQAYGQEKLLGVATEKTEAKGLLGGKEYTFKITSKDRTGNESKGTIISILLPQTGPALPVAVAISLLAGRFLRKKRKCPYGQK